MRSNFALFCTPAINLFDKRADRIHVSDSALRVPRRRRPDPAAGLRGLRRSPTSSATASAPTASSEFLPFYAAYSRDEAHAVAPTSRRGASRGWCRRTSKRRGPRSSYIGTEVFLSLVDPAQAPFSGDLRQLSIAGAVHQPRSRAADADRRRRRPTSRSTSPRRSRASASISGPSRPYAPLADGAMAWRAISHLSLNYLSLVQSTPQEGAAALRDLLELYAPSDRRERAAADRGHPVGAASAAWCAGCAGSPGPTRASAAASRSRVDVDELAFEGGSAFLLGPVLDRYFARHVSINSFTETVLRSESRGEINRWAPQWGARPTL